MLHFLYTSYAIKEVSGLGVKNRIKVARFDVVHIFFYEHRQNNKCIYPVDVTLVEEDKENDVISEASKTIHGWHLNDKGKNVIDERIQRLISHHPPWKMCH